MNFTPLSPYDFEFLTEDILKLKGFTIVSRPALGPDQGRDMIAERLVTDDMRITTRERYLIQCKHFTTKNKPSVKESDIPNFITKAKHHKANRYLLVTSGLVSETVKDLFQAENNDDHSGIKCAFFNKYDLKDYIFPYPELYEKYFNQSDRPLEDKAKRLLTFLKTHQFQVHRGALLYSDNITAVFGNDGHKSESMVKALALFRAALKKEKISEITYTTCEGSSSWVMFVDSADARLLHEKIWEFYPASGVVKIAQMDEAFQRLWTHWDTPFDKTF